MPSRWRTAPPPGNDFDFEAAGGGPCPVGFGWAERSRVKPQEGAERPRLEAAERSEQVGTGAAYGG
jgi:hypothetical protein